MRRGGGVGPFAWSLIIILPAVHAVQGLLEGYSCLGHRMLGSECMIGASTARVRLLMAAAVIGQVSPGLSDYASQGSICFN